MRKITDLSELHEIVLGIMKCVRDFCNDRNIRYFLCGGTLLGAVRHKGFIPWDDDADIGMLRPDLTRFCREFKSDRYVIVRPETDSGSRALWPKVVDTKTIVKEEGSLSKTQGVFVDLCPFDGAPRCNWYPRTDHAKLWDIVTRALNQRNAPVFSHSYSFGTQCSLLLGSPLRLVPNWAFTKALTWFAARHSTESSPYIGGIVMGYGVREVLPRAVFEGSVSVEFEGEKFLAMSGWNEYLTALYGDWKTPPPPHDRSTAHHFQAWWKD